ncbi:MAG: HAD hydrolase family protein [Thermoplasmata archaeon]|nr:HAD hydrolase family protein [Thermoplasmata archaeon]
MPAFPYRLVCVDIDGTLTRGHGWVTLAERFGRSEAYARTQVAYRSGAIDEDTHLYNLMALAEGSQLTEVETILEATPKVSGIGEGVRRLHSLGAHVALLSHNPSYVTDWYARRFGMDAADGVAGSPTVVNGVIGRAARPRSDKVGGLDRLCARFDVTRHEAVHVGDGRADAQVFPLVGLGIAFGTQLPDVRAAADVSVDVPDFLEVVRVLETTPPARR